MGREKKEEGYYLDVGIRKEDAGKYDVFIVYKENTVEGTKWSTCTAIGDNNVLKKDITGTDFLIGCTVLTTEEYREIARG